MSYSSSTSITDQSDLMSQISTFAVSTNGWTQDNYDGTGKKMSLHKGSCYVHFFWNDTSTNGGIYGTSIGMYQSLGYISAGTNPWAHTDDSQNGANSASNLDQERGIKFIGPGPYTSLHMFGHTDIDVIYCILEFAPGLYRHFGFGNIEKKGSWTGGEWVGGHNWSPENSGFYLDDPTGFVHSILLDGVNYGFIGSSPSYPTSTRVNATLHVESLPNQTTENPKWGIVGDAYNMTSASYRQGRDGNDRAPIYGGIRNGIAVQQLGWVLPDLTKGYVPIIPAELYYWDFQVGDAEHIYYLGRMHNCGMITLRGIDPQQAITVGSDTWRAFPAVRKSKVGGNVQESWNMGIIYKQ